MQMDAGLDTGPVLLERRIAIGATETAGALHDRLAAQGGAAIVEALAGRFTPRPQPGDGVTYAAKISPEEARLDWQRPAAELERAVRAFNPVPGAWTLLPNGERMKILSAEVSAARGMPGTIIDDRLTIACGSGALRPLLVQRQGKRAMETAETHARPGAEARRALRVTRFKLTIEYDGSGFVGWQRQAEGMTIQQALEEAISASRRRPPRCRGAGRTDSGVHALAQVAHVDIEKPIAADKLRDALNFHLKPAPIGVLASEVVASDFHARFSATGRAYLYRIVNRRAPLTVDRGRAWLINTPLDAGGDACGGAGARRPPRFHHLPRHALPGAVASEDPGTPQRAPRRRGDSGHRRIPLLPAPPGPHMVGTLRLVGEGKWSKADVEHALEAKDRSEGGPTAPPMAST